MGQKYFIRLLDGKKLLVKQQAYYFRFKCQMEQWIIPERIEILDAKDAVIATIRPRRAGETIRRGDEIRL
jgi:hypothetical protein